MKTVIDCVVSPLLQLYDDIPAGAVRVTLPPAQNVVGPEVVMVALGGVWTGSVMEPELLQPLLSVMVTVSTTCGAPALAVK